MFKRLDNAGLKKAQFCRKYGFSQPWLTKALIADPLPSWMLIDRVDAAMKMANKEYLSHVKKKS